MELLKGEPDRVDLKQGVGGGAQFFWAFCQILPVYEEKLTGYPKSAVQGRQMVHSMHTVSKDLKCSGDSEILLYTK